MLQPSPACIKVKQHSHYLLKTNPITVAHSRSHCLTITIHTYNLIIIMALPLHISSKIRQYFNTYRSRDGYSLKGIKFIPESTLFIIKYKGGV